MYPYPEGGWDSRGVHRRNRFVSKRLPYKRAGRRIRGGKGGNAHLWWISGCHARGFSSKTAANAPGAAPEFFGEVPDIKFEIFFEKIHPMCAGYT